MLWLSLFSSNGCCLVNMYDVCAYKIIIKLDEPYHNHTASVEWKLLRRDIIYQAIFCDFGVHFGICRYRYLHMRIILHKHWTLSTFLSSQSIGCVCYIVIDISVCIYSKSQEQLPAAYIPNIWLSLDLYTMAIHIPIFSLLRCSSSSLKTFFVFFLLYCDGVYNRILHTQPILWES